MLTRQLRIRVLIALNVVMAASLAWPEGHSNRTVRFALTAPASAVTAPASPAAGASIDANALPHLSPRADTRYVYTFQRKISIHGLTSEIPDIVFHGTLALDVTHADARGFEAVAEDDVADAPNVAGARFRVHVDADGGALTLAGAPPTTDAERQQSAILKDLMANWVFAAHSDTVGRYTASFQRLADSGTPRFTKRKLAYVDARDPIPAITSSLHVMEWASDLGLPRTLKGRESTALGTGRLGLASDSEYILRFARIERSQLGGVQLAGLDHAETLSIGGSPHGPRGLARPIPDWASLARRIEGLAALTSPQQLELFGDVVASLRAGATSLSDLTALLSPSVVQAGPGSSLFKLAVGALATAASPAAQAALVNLYQDPNCSTDGKGTILAAFTTTQAPLNSDTRDFLAEESAAAASQDLANGAAFALGASLQNAPSDASATKAIAQIQTDWSQESAAGSKFQEMALMDVMGNSGKTDFYPDLANVISTSSDPTLRSKAVFDLRFMTTPDAVNLLDQSLNDPTPGVRMAAANAMLVGPWNASFSAPLSHCVASEQIPEIQKACQSALGRGSSQ